MFTKQEILQFVKENDVKFVRLAFCDIFGQIKNFSVMAEKLEQVLSEGAFFCPQGVKGFEDVKEDLILIPDVNTMSVLPWRPSQGRVIKFFCELKYPDGSLYNDGRQFLKTVIDKVAKKGYEINVGTEAEFYLFKTDENGMPTFDTHDKGGYLDMSPLDKGENVRREICFSLEEMGITPLASHHEKGPGQHEIVYSLADALTACDNFLTFKSTVKAIAGRNGLHASFMPKPLKDKNGNGLHINLAVYKNGKNIFADFKNKEAGYFMAGVMSRMKEITAFINSTVNSYSRLGLYEAPEFIFWSKDNFGQLLRLAKMEGEDIIEIRSPDSALNLYLAIGLIILAGINGIENKTKLLDRFLFSENYDKALVDNSQILPLSLHEALKEVEKSEFIAKNVPQDLLKKYITLKALEIKYSETNPLIYETEQFNLL